MQFMSQCPIPQVVCCTMIISYSGTLLAIYKDKPDIRRIRTVSMESQLDRIVYKTTMLEMKTPPTCITRTLSTVPRVSSYNREVPQYLIMMM